MPQISLYIDEQTLKKVEMAARKQHVSISKWVSQHLKAKLAPEYPPDYKNLFGCIPKDALRRPDTPDFDLDAKRDRHSEHCEGRIASGRGPGRSSSRYLW